MQSLVLYPTKPSLRIWRPREKAQFVVLSLGQMQCSVLTPGGLRDQTLVECVQDKCPTLYPQSLVPDYLKICRTFWARTGQIEAT